MQVVQRLLVRNPTRAPKLPRTEIVEAPYGDPDAVASGLSGVQTVLMVSASETPDRMAQHRSFIDAAVRAGIEHLIYVSFVGAGPAASFTLAREHWATEQHILASGLTHTFLRDNLYADFIPAMIGKDDIIRGPDGTGRVAVVAQDDIADVAAAVVTEPGAHRGATSHRYRCHHGRGHRAQCLLPPRDRRGGIRIPGSVRRSSVAGRGLGVDLRPSAPVNLTRSAATSRESP